MKKIYSIVHTSIDRSEDELQRIINENYEYFSKVDSGALIRCLKISTIVYVVYTDKSFMRLT